MLKLNVVYSSSCGLMDNPQPPTALVARAAKAIVPVYDTRPSAQLKDPTKSNLETTPAACYDFEKRIWPVPNFITKTHPQTAFEHAPTTTNPPHSGRVSEPRGCARSQPRRAARAALPA